MKRFFTKYQIVLYSIPFIAIIILEKDNVLRIEDSIENLLWTIIFPVLLVLLSISLVLVVRAFSSSENFRKLLNSVSSKTFRYVGGALLVSVAAVFLVSMAESVIGIYLDHTAISPTVFVIDRFRIRPNVRRYETCITEIEFYTNTKHRLCIERSFGLPAISAKSGIAESGSLCVKGRESSVGAVVDQIVIMPDEGLNMDAKQLRCAQFFSDT